VTTLASKDFLYDTCTCNAYLLISKCVHKRVNGRVHIEQPTNENINHKRVWVVWSPKQTDVVADEVRRPEGEIGNDDVAQAVEDLRFLRLMHFWCVIWLVHFWHVVTFVLFWQSNNCLSAGWNLRGICFRCNTLDKFNITIFKKRAPQK